MPRWVISVPAWGDQYIAAALRISLPSIVAAAKYAHHEALFVVHTDKPSEFRDCFGGFPYQLRSVLADSHGSCLADFHRDALTAARVGDFFSPLNADCVVSREVFAASEQRFIQGKRIVVCAPVRTVGWPSSPGLDAEALIDFMLANPHPLVVRATWAMFATFQPATIYLRQGESFACHSFNMHPVGLVVPEGGITYTGSVDDNLHECFERTDYHIVTDTELAVIEMTPLGQVSTWDAYGPEGPPGLYKAKPAEWIVKWAMGGRLPMQRWHFRHRVSYRGGDFSDDPMPAILAGLDQAEQRPLNDGPVPMFINRV